MLGSPCRLVAAPTDIAGSDLNLDAASSPGLEAAAAKLCKGPPKLGGRGHSYSLVCIVPCYVPMAPGEDFGEEKGAMGEGEPYRRVPQAP